MNDHTLNVSLLRPEAKTASRVSAAPGLPIVEINGVSISFIGAEGSTQAVADATLTVRAGEFLAIVGPSGCGKSTLLNVIVGLLKPSAGRIGFKGKAVNGIQRDVGYVTQADNLLPWRNLIDNVAFALELRGYPKSERYARASGLLTQVGLAGFERRYPHELSGGMRQRANIARTLSYEPELILMDEPFGPLDAQTRLVLQRQLLSLWESTGKTIVFVTHDLQEAIALADRVAIMSARPGRIRAIEQVNIPRPRIIPEVFDDDAFRALHRALWVHLEDEVNRGVPEAQS